MKKAMLRRVLQILQQDGLSLNESDKAALLAMKADADGLYKLTLRRDFEGAFREMTITVRIITDAEKQEDEKS